MFEGGNLYKTNDPQFPFDSHQDLELMTANKNYQVSGYCQHRYPGKGRQELRPVQRRR